MTDRIQAGGLQVAKEFYDFINERAIPGTGVAVDAFWTGFGKIIADLAPRNRALLAKRDDIQAKIDAAEARKAMSEHLSSVETVL